MISSEGWSRCLHAAMVAWLFTSIVAAGGCTTGSSSSGGRKAGSSWSLFGEEPKKVRTTSDFIGLPRPEE